MKASIQVLPALFLLFILTDVGANAQSERAKTPTTRAFEANGMTFRAHVDEKTGTPYWILDVDSLDFSLGEKRSYESSSTVVAAARDFLTRNSDVFGLGAAILELDRATTDGELWFISFRQVHDGIPVVGANVGLTVSKTGRLVAAGVRTFAGLTVDTTPALSSAQAVQSARSFLDRPDAAQSRPAELAILPHEGKEAYSFNLAWRLDLVSTLTEDPLGAAVFVDAHSGTVLAHDDHLKRSHAYLPFAALSGEILYVESNPRARSESSSETKSGTSRMYHSDAVQEAADESQLASAASGSNSLSGYVTLNYYESPDNLYDDLERKTDKGFSWAKVKVVRTSDGWNDDTFANESGLYSISVPSSGWYNVTFYLENPYAYITSGLSSSEKSKTFSVYISGSTVYSYDWDWGDGGDLPSSSNTARALTAVHGIGQMYDYMKNTRGYSGMDSEDPRELTIVSYDAGSTFPPTGSITLGGPSGQSDEVAQHEYMHNLIYVLYGHAISSSSGNDPDYDAQEGAAMDEGFSDYFPSAHKGNSTFGGPAAPPAGTESTFPYNDGASNRYLYNTCTMNDFNGSWPCGGSAHSRSRIISGAVWRIRIAIGTEADKLAFKALQIAPQPQSFVSYRNRMLAADDFYNAGANRATIEQKFADRYIGGPIEPGLLSLGLDGSDFPTLDWSDKSSVEDGYRVERKYNSGSWTVIDNLSANTEDYLDNDYRCLGGGSGTYYYRVQAWYENSGNPDEVSYSNTVSLNLSTCDTGPFKSGGDGIAGRSAELPLESQLSPAYPNPFNPATTVGFQLAEGAKIRLTVFDVLGREVAVLADGSREAGFHEIRFDASSLPSGVYVYQLETPYRVLTRTMLLSK